MKDKLPKIARLWFSKPQTARRLVVVAQEVFEETSARNMCATIVASGQSNRPLPATGFRVRDINFIFDPVQEPQVIVRERVTKGPFPYSVDDEAPVRIDGCLLTTWGELRRLARSDERETPGTARDQAPLETWMQRGVCIRTENNAPMTVDSFSLAPWNPPRECGYG